MWAAPLLLLLVRLVLVLVLLVLLVLLLLLLARPLARPWSLEDCVPSASPGARIWAPLLDAAWA